MPLPRGSLCRLYRFKRLLAIMSLTVLPNETLRQIFEDGSQPSSAFQCLYHPRVQAVDLAYFPRKDQGSLNEKKTLCLVNKRFRDIAQPMLLRTVHLNGWKNVESFALTASHGAIHVRELSLSHLEGGDAPSDHKKIALVFLRASLMITRMT